MIFGVGTDIVQIPRIEGLIDKYDDAFKNKILHEAELLLLQKLPLNKHASFLAKRFAAKEAVSKALGKGIGRGLKFQDIIVLNNEFGTPYVVINSKNPQDMGKQQIFLSLSDDYPVAIAFVVIGSKHVIPATTISVESDVRVV